MPDNTLPIHGIFPTPAQAKKFVPMVVKCFGIGARHEWYYLVPHKYAFVVDDLLRQDALHKKRETEYNALRFTLNKKGKPKPYPKRKRHVVALQLQNHTHYAYYSVMQKLGLFWKDNIGGMLDSAVVESYYHIPGAHSVIDWEGFGPGALEGISYKIERRRGRDVSVDLRGFYTVYNGNGTETNVNVETGFTLDTEKGADDFETQVQDAINYYLDEHPELWDAPDGPEYEDDELL